MPSSPSSRRSSDQTKSSAKAESQSGPFDNTLALLSGYWFTTRLLFERVSETREALWGPASEQRTEDETDTIGRNLRSYVQHWILSLSAVCECFVQLRLDDEAIVKAIDQNLPFLRAYRESYFAFAISEEGLFGPNWPGEAKLNAVEDLHQKFDTFFVTYFKNKYPSSRG